MDMYANKNIKITKNTLTGVELLTFNDKHSIKNSNFKNLGKKFYSSKPNFSKDNSKDDSKYLTHITPFKLKKTKPESKEIDILDFITQDPKPFSGVDIETMAFNGKDYPISISIKTRNITKLFLIELKLKPKFRWYKPQLGRSFGKINLDYRFSNKIINLFELNLAVKKLWDKFFDFILLKCDKEVLFIHNLGKFDGLYLYKGLSNKFKPDEVSCLMDNQNKFIRIVLAKGKKKITFKDSYRIFGVSLQALSDILAIPGKASVYNPKFHNISLFNNKKLLQEFKKYSIQDSIALFNCLDRLQEIYLRDYLVDITKVLSTSTLSMQIFRSKFLTEEIPVLKRIDDTFIRNSYFGGATDYYQLNVKNLYYYDVNSLYPFAMTNPMPFDIIRKFNFKEDTKFDLNNFFGFLNVEVYCPKNLQVPVLPCKFNGKTIFPTGSFTGTYFSEELKAVLPFGYKFKFIKGIEFSKKDLFSEYVNHFYLQKKISVGDSRFIAKMHLNQLYGSFGRKHDQLETINIYTKDLDKYILSRVIKTIIPINNKILTLLMHANIRDELISELNSDLKIELSNRYSLVKANVAIASAVTSYSRIHMIPYKITGDCVYTDTDSIFTTKKLKTKFIGSDLGLMKDELNGLQVKEAYFLGIKKYGYQYYNESNQLITKSVFSGIKRDSLTFDEIVKLSHGEKITKVIPLRFYRSMQDMSVSIRSSNVTISRTLDKPLINNRYIPLHLKNIESSNNNFFNYLKHKIVQKLRDFFNYKN